MPRPRGRPRRNRGGGGDGPRPQFTDEERTFLVLRYAKHQGTRDFKDKVIKNFMVCLTKVHL